MAKEVDVLLTPVDVDLNQIGVAIVTNQALFYKLIVVCQLT
jgi:hypothetical protein